jgi:hypothetical protein
MSVSSPGTERSVTGRLASLFNLEHYAATMPAWDRSAPVGNPQLLRLIRASLDAGVLEEGSGKRK